ncbi:hypothetical protein [Isoptericola sp. NPDC055063]
MGGTLTKRDIAIAAGVTRQAVTNWCRRATVHGALHPFPAAVASTAGVERFDSDEVMAWLSATGRGRNSDASLDAPALTPPDDAVLEDAVALLALRSQSGDDLADLTRYEIGALVASVDPQDRVLASEAASAAASHALREYVDGLWESAFGPGDALDRLLSSRLGRELGERGLTRDAVDLLGVVARACAQYLGAGAVVLDAPDAVAGALGEDAIVVTPHDRELRRRLMIRGVSTAEAAASVVHVAALVGLGDDEVLDRVDDIADGLAGGSVAIVLGPSSVLCDEVRGEILRRRRATLDVGNLVATVRLPRGWWRGAHRQALGLWVLQSTREERSPLVADVTGKAVNVGDVVDDVLGALAQSRARRFRYGRALRYDRVAAGNPLVPPGMAPAPLRGADLGHRDALTAASLQTSDPVPGFDVLVLPGRDEPAPPPRSLGQMLDERAARRVRGSRIADEHTEPSGTTRILSADPTEPERRIDPLVAAQHYDRAQRTEPGDVVVTATPRPYALVDEVGGALIRSPSAVVRLSEHAGIGPHALAAWIDHLQSPAADWRAWPVPRLPPDQIASVEATLTAAAAHLRELRRREAAMHDLVHHLVQGAAIGALVLDPATARKKAG